MKTTHTAIPLNAVRRGLDTSVASEEAPVAERAKGPRTQSRLAQWFAILALAIALAPGAASAQEDGTVTISGVFSMDYLSGESDLYYFAPDLLWVYYNGHQHTWTLTLHGTSQSHLSNGSYFGTEIHATSFDLKFFGPDADTLNAVVSNRLAGADASLYLQNTYYTNGGGFAIMHVLVGAFYSGNLYFYSGQEMGVAALFPTDANGYPIVRPEPISIEPDYTEFGELDMLSSTGFEMGSLAGPVTFEGSVGQPPPPPPPPTLRIGDSSVVEGNSSSTQMKFTVSRSGSTEGKVSVNYRTVDGTASAKSDYNAASGTLVFQPGVSSQTITIKVNSDHKREPNETFTVELFNAVGASVVDAVATGTILNDD